jgi:integrase
MNEPTTTRAELLTANPEGMILALSDCYSNPTRVFVRFLHERGLGFDAQGIAAFSAYLREEHDGKRRAARSVNFYLAAVKNRVRYLLDHSPALSEGARAAVERVLQEVKAEKVVHEGVSAERCLTYAEVGKVIAAAQRINPRIALIAEFLAVTGCRISETLQVLNTDVKPAGDQYRITLHGKGGKDRKVYIPAELLKRIRRVFVGKKYLFAHSRTQRLYTRTYVSMTLRRIGAKAIGRNISAHVFRHSWATDMLRRNPGDLVSISRYLGHSQVSTTENTYLHGGYTGADIAAKAPRLDLVGATA